VTPADVDAAATAIRGAVLETPTTRSVTLSAITGAEVWCTFENLQFTASFKERGALNFLLRIPEAERENGVVAASAGNHAQGLSYHAARLGVPVAIVMPRDTAFTKIARTEVLGAEVVLEGDSFDEAVTTARRIASERGARFVPAFDDPAIIAGQGTIAREVLTRVPDLDVLVVPTGGGGLLAGIAVAARALRPDIEIVGVQAAGWSGMVHALGRGPAPEGGPTIADGIAVLEPGLITRALVARLVDDVVTVDEDLLEQAVAMFLEIEKVVVEGAGAAGLAALLGDPDRFRGRRVGLIVSGGNIDLRVLSSVVLRALARSGRLHRWTIEVSDRPGSLASIATAIAELGGNVVDVAHHRDLPGVPLRRALLEVSVETRDAAAAERIVAEITVRGFSVHRVGAVPDSSA